jgi:hypothetical protein
MKTKAELEQDIMNITLKINQEFPELSKYLKEMPISVPGNPNDEINNESLKEYYNSLAEILGEYSKTHGDEKEKKNTEGKFSGYPLYPPSEDIYNKGKKESDLNPENMKKKKDATNEAGTMNEKDFNTDMSGDDLDVPGAELDDKQERKGSEDEENNYYSLGGDNHDD